MAGTTMTTKWEREFTQRWYDMQELFGIQNFDMEYRLKFTAGWLQMQMMFIRAGVLQ